MQCFNYRRISLGCKVKLLMCGSCLCYCMNENSILLFYYLLVNTSSANPMIYAIKFIACNFLGC